ncbi:MAG: bleomycin resistance protein [Catenulispora sp.]|nr:bleomycin resistance protein [Catenulispora sp.]
MDGGVRFVAAVLGVEPTFVDGARWAQFDLGGARLALASGAESSGAAQLMVKVGDVAAVGARLAAAGYDVAGPVTGPHEVRLSVAGPDGWSVVLYEPR